MILRRLDPTHAYFEHGHFYKILIYNYFSWNGKNARFPSNARTVMELCTRTHKNNQERQAIMERDPMAVLVWNNTARLGWT